MSRYHLYTQIKDDPVVTFKCEACGERFPACKLYGRRAVIDLRNGNFADSRGKIYNMTCSLVCSRRVKRRSIFELHKILDAKVA